MNTFNKIKHNKIFIVFVFPLLLLIFSFIIRLIALLQTEYGNGWDSYFYLIQIKAIITEGKMHSNDISLIYPYLLLLKLVVSDYIVSYKIAIVLISGFYVLTFYLLAKAVLIKKHQYINILLITSFVIFSPTITYMASQFPKNLMGLVFFNFFLIYWIKEKRWQILLFFVLTFLTHRLTAGVICIFIIIELISKRKYLWLVLLVITTILLSLILPGTIHFYDMERFKHILTVKMQLAPISFIEIIGFHKIGFFWLLEITVSIIILIITIISLIFYRQHLSPVTQKFYFTMVFISIVLLFPFYNFDINGPALRFFLSFLCIAPIFLIFISEKINYKIKVIFILFFLISALFSFKSYNPTKLDPPYKMYSKIAENTVVLLKNKKIEIIIAHKALAEYFTFTTGIDALPWQPESKYHLSKIWRISSGISMNDFKYYFTEPTTDSIKKIGINYFLIPESLWQRFIKEIKQKDDLNLMKVVYSDKNPYKIRPQYLLRGKK